MRREYPQGFDRILVQRVESPHPWRHHTPIGERLPLHIGVSGHILCAGMPKQSNIVREVS